MNTADLVERPTLEKVVEELNRAHRRELKKLSQILLPKGPQCGA